MRRMARTLLIIRRGYEEGAGEEQEQDASINDVTGMQADSY